MIKVIIVDDETIMRVTMRSLIDWESHGYTIVDDCVMGTQVLEYLQDHTVDLLITDMKMPVMSGIELIEQLHKRGNMPVTIVLSGYNEFDLVRKAFRLGVYDYILKADLNEHSLGLLLDNLRQKIFTDEITQQTHKPTSNITTRPTLAAGNYSVALFSLEDFVGQATRFGSNLRDKLELPMLELARQIPRIGGQTTIRALDPSRYELCYHLRDNQQWQSTVISVVRQIQSVWHDYMNLSVCASISNEVASTEIAQAVEQCEQLLKLTVLQGRGGVTLQWKHSKLASFYALHSSSCDALIEALCTGEYTKLEQAKVLFFEWMECHSLEDRQYVYPTFLSRMNEKLIEYGQDFLSIFPEQTEYQSLLSSLPSSKEQELWLRNFLRRAHEYFASRHRQQQNDPIKKARLFMEDNYTNPELTLRTVADYIGFNEKYFSSRFTKECGCTFVTFLNQLRLQRAQRLLTQTNMRMYEISEYVGYNNVEHFNHTFKRVFGTSPSEYRNGI